MRIVTGPIAPLVRMPMSMHQRQLVERLDAEDFSQVVRLARKELRKQGFEASDEYCERAVTATKQYYALTIFDPHNMHAISDVLDPFWHAHILDTVRYRMLCDDLGGFMHHDPLDMDDVEKVAMVGRVYRYTQTVLDLIFGEENLDAEFYPRKMPEIRMVCRHDVEVMAGGPGFPDAFPEVAEFAPLRRRYGFQAQKDAIRQTLAA